MKFICTPGTLLFSSTQVYVAVQRLSAYAIGNLWRPFSSSSCVSTRAVEQILRTACRQLHAGSLVARLLPVRIPKSGRHIWWFQGRVCR